MRKSLPGTAACFKVFGGNEGVSYRIVLEDTVSGIRFAEATLTPEAFAAAITGQQVRCELDLHLVNVGKRRELKTEIIDLPDAARYDRAKLPADFWNAYEVDGWTASRDDLFNGHRRVPTGQRVHFHRFVEATEADVAKARERRQ